MSSENLSLSVEKRQVGGKCVNKRLRLGKMIPGIYYNAKGDNIPVVVNELPLSKLYEKAGSSTMFNLLIQEGGSVDERPSLIWKVHHHPVKNKILHVDFFGVQMDVEMRLTVPFLLQGTPKGIKEGGILELFRDNLEIVCLPKDIPHSIIVDVSGLSVNESIRISDLKLPEGVRTASDENYAVAGVVVPQAEKAPAAAEEGAATAEDSAE